jgi:hypothetical protein
MTKIPPCHDKASLKQMRPRGSQAAHFGKKPEKYRLVSLTLYFPKHNDLWPRWRCEDYISSRFRGTPFWNQPDNLCLFVI